MLLLIAMALGLSQPGQHAAHAQSAEPVWEVAPEPVFPKAASSRALFRGEAVLTCHVRPDRHVRDCTVVSEHPRRYGFGDAALASVDAAILDAASVQGRNPNEPITFTIKFETGS